MESNQFINKYTTFWYISNKVLFSDESKYDVFGLNKRRYVQGKSNSEILKIDVLQCRGMYGYKQHCKSRFRS